MMEFSCCFGIIKFHETPWNLKSLNAKSLEIDFIESNNNSEQLLRDFCEHKEKESYKLISVRVLASDNLLKKNFLLNGFNIVEHTLDVYTNGLDFKKLTDLSKLIPLSVDDYNESDIIHVRDISEHNFKFGRFYEDPFIDSLISTKRSFNWIDDLINQNVTIKVVKKKNIVVGFLAYEVHQNKAELILGGVKENYRHLSYSFWSKVLLNIESSSINTRISSSNIDVLNLYSFLGFKFTNPQFGFHKHLF